MAPIPFTSPAFLTHGKRPFQAPYTAGPNSQRARPAGADPSQRRPTRPPPASANPFLELVTDSKPARPRTIDGFRGDELVAVLEQVGARVRQILHVQLSGPSVLGDAG